MLLILNEVKTTSNDKFYRIKFAQPKAAAQQWHTRMYAMTILTGLKLHGQRLPRSGGVQGCMP
jgi:hypothetical protein